MDVRFLFGSNDTWVAGREDAFLVEWGESSWRAMADGTIDAPHSVISHRNDDGIPFARAVQATNDTFPRMVQHDGIAFRTTALKEARFPLIVRSGSSMFLSLADLGGPEGDTAVAIEHITFYPEALCDDDPVDATWTQAAVYHGD